MINKNSRIFLSGHKGHLGSAILNQLKLNNYKNIITKKSQLDLLKQKSF